jgi:hypothetical protein
MSPPKPGKIFNVKNKGCGSGSDLDPGVKDSVDPGFNEFVDPDPGCKKMKKGNALYISFL